MPKSPYSNKASKGKIWASIITVIVADSRKEENFELSFLDLEAGAAFLLPCESDKNIY